MGFEVNDVEEISAREFNKFVRESNLSSTLKQTPELESFIKSAYQAGFAIVFLNYRKFLLELRTRYEKKEKRR